MISALSPEQPLLCSLPAVVKPSLNWQRGLPAPAHSQPSFPRVPTVKSLLRELRELGTAPESVSL